MAAAFDVVLPHGFARDGGRRVDAVLRPPSGADEAFLLERRAGTRAERVTGLLARCTLALGGREPAVEELRALTVGDREALLLHLRAAALGGRIACVVDCPACGERLDLDVDVADALVAPYGEAPELHEAAFGGYTVRFRLPTGADQEEAARASDPLAGAQVLLRRCVEEVLRDGRRVEEVPEPVAEGLPALLAELDPQAEALVALRCPECGAEAQALLDAATILFGELAGSSERLFLEVHALALHYHWSEREILGLDVPRRRRYLQLLADMDGALA
jgi:alkylhydroperoxidase family enzyme